MENFKVTSIDDVVVKEQPKPNTDGKQEENTGTDASADANTNTSPQAEVETSASPSTEAAETRQEVQEPHTDNEPRDQVDTPTFETSSVDFEEAKVEETVVEHDVPNKIDLKTFIEENTDVISKYHVLNQDYSGLEDDKVIELHLKDAHPSLSQEDIKSLLSEYSFDEETEDRADIVKKKIALDKAATEARIHLNTQKDHLLRELETRQLGGRSAKDEANIQAAQEAQRVFLDQTEQVFSGESKSFAFEMSDTKKLNIKINNVGAVKSQQSDINNFIGKYFDLKTNTPTDVEGYHKAMFVAMNHEQMLRNAYQQGQADAITNESAKAKNINMDGRNSHPEVTNKKITWKHVN